MTLDQKPIKLSEEEEKTGFLALANKALGELENGLDAVSEYINIFIELERDGRLAQAVTLHGVNSVWGNADIEGKEDGESFREWAERKTGLARATIQRRVCTWEFLTKYVPSEHYEAFMRNWSVGMLSRGYRIAVKHSENKKIGNYDLIPSGNEIEPADWLSLSECVDSPMMIEVLDKISGKEPNSNRISFSEGESGEIRFHRGKKDTAIIGSMNVWDGSSFVADGISEVRERLGIK